MIWFLHDREFRLERVNDNNKVKRNPEQAFQVTFRQTVSIILFFSYKEEFNKQQVKVKRSLTLH